MELKVEFDALELFNAAITTGRSYQLVIQELSRAAASASNRIIHLSRTEDGQFRASEPYTRGVPDQLVIASYLLQSPYVKKVTLAGSPSLEETHVLISELAGSHLDTMLRGIWGRDMLGDRFPRSADPYYDPILNFLQRYHEWSMPNLVGMRIFDSWGRTVTYFPFWNKGVLSS